MLVLVLVLVSVLILSNVRLCVSVRASFHLTIMFYWWKCLSIITASITLNNISIKTFSPVKYYRKMKTSVIVSAVCCASLMVSVGVVIVVVLLLIFVYGVGASFGFGGGLSVSLGALLTVYWFYSLFWRQLVGKSILMILLVILWQWGVREKYILSSLFLSLVLHASSLFVVCHFLLTFVFACSLLCLLLDCPLFFCLFFPLPCSLSPPLLFTLP